MRHWTNTLICDIRQQSPAAGPQRALLPGWRRQKNLVNGEREKEVNQVQEYMTDMAYENQEMESVSEIGGVDWKADENMMRLFGLVG